MKLMLIAGLVPVALVLASCAPDGALEPTDTSGVNLSGEAQADPVLGAPPSSAVGTDGSLPTPVGPDADPALELPPPIPASLRGSPEPIDLVPAVIEVIPHDRESYTQGLLIEDGRMFESAGGYGASTLREVDPATGEVIRVVENNLEVFAEGLELVGDQLIQLTWREGLAYVWDAASLELLDIHSYEGEGWGLCSDGVRLVMSDGTDRLTFRDPVTFEASGSVSVTLDGNAVDRLNELECVDGWVVANVWKDDIIVVIDRATGIVRGVVDASDLVDEAVSTFSGADVLNGIAYDEDTGAFHVTGKFWPSTFVVRFAEHEPDG